MYPDTVTSALWLTEGEGTTLMKDDKTSEIISLQMILRF